MCFYNLKVLELRKGKVLQYYNRVVLKVKL